VARKTKTKREVQVAVRVRKSANQIFLAGLGAFSEAQKRGPKIYDALVKEGTGVFNRLVREGAVVQKRATRLADAKMDEMKAAASSTWTALESAFEDRVVGVLHRLNVATKSDVDALVRRIGGPGVSRGASRSAASAGRGLTRRLRAAKRK